MRGVSLIPAGRGLGHQVIAILGNGQVGISTLSLCEGTIFVLLRTSTLVSGMETTVLHPTPTAPKVMYLGRGVLGSF